MSLHSFVSELDGYTTIPLEKQILFEKRRVILEESKIQKYDNRRIIEIEREMTCEETEWLNDAEMDDAIVCAYISSELNISNEIKTVCFFNSTRKRMFLIKALQIANVGSWFETALSAIHCKAHSDVLSSIVKKNWEEIYRSSLFLILIEHAVRDENSLMILINDLKLYMNQKMIISNTDKLMWMMGKREIHQRISSIYNTLFDIQDCNDVIRKLDIINPLFICYISSMFPIWKLISGNRIDVLRKIVEDFTPNNVSFHNKLERFICFYKQKTAFFPEEEVLVKMFSLKRREEQYCQRTKVRVMN